MNGKRSYAEDLDTAIGEYLASPGSDSLFTVLCVLFDGIENNYSLPCPSEINPDDMSVKPMFLQAEDGYENLVLLTDPDFEEYPTTAEIRLRAVTRLIFKTERCEGIIFNPSGKHSFFIPRRLLAHALSAGRSMTAEDAEKERKTGAEKSEFRFSDDNSVEIRRPTEWEKYEVIEDRIRSLTEDEDDYVIVDLIEDRDDLRFIQTIRHGGLWYVELAYDMSDFGREYPLILGAETELEEAVDLFRLICAHGVSPDDIPMVQERFRDTDFHGADDE